MFNESWLQLRKFPTYQSSKKITALPRKNKTLVSTTPWPLLQGLKALIEIRTVLLLMDPDKQLIYVDMEKIPLLLQGYYTHSRCLFGISSMKQYEKESSLCYSCYFIFSILSTCGILSSKGLSKVKKCQSVQLQPVEQCLEVSGSHSNSHFIGSLQ